MMTPDAPPSICLVPCCDRGQRIPLSFGQERLWFLEQLAPGQHTYHEQAAYRLQGPLDRAALQRSFQEIVQRHEVLRTTIGSAEGQPFQVIHAAPTVALPLIELGQTSSADCPLALDAALRRELSHSFDLTRDIPLRTGLIRVHDDEHVLWWMIHHIACDGWSLQVLRGELAALYSAYRLGRASPLAPLPRQYADFAAWQRTALQGPPLDDLLCYWRNRWRGIPGRLELPTDRPPAPELRYRGRRVTFDLPVALSSQIRQRAQQARVTPFMLLLAAFQVLLHRYSGQSALAVGVPVAGRLATELEANIGLFISLVPHAVRVQEQQTFAEFLRQVRQCCLEAQQHQTLPFEQLVQELQPQRDLLHAPLVQVLFALQPGLPQEWHLEALEVQRMLLAAEATQFELDFRLWNTADHFAGCCIYAVDRYHEDSIRHLIDGFLTLLEAAVGDPLQALARLPLLNAAARQRLLAAGRTPAAATTPPRLVHELFAARAAEDGERPAVVCDGVCLSYGELQRRVDCRAHRLRALGVGPERLVGVRLEPSLELVTSLLAILQVGGVYVPFDPDVPRERLAFMVQDAEVPWLLTRRSLAPDPPLANCRVVCLEENNDPPSTPCAAERPAVRPESLAYVIYTSGSTGAPKGVMIEQRALAQFLQAMNGQPGLSANDWLLSVSPSTFDISLLELLWPLTVGARVELVGRNVARNPLELRKRLDRGDVTVMQATPATWRMLVEAGWVGRPALKILCGGEALLPDLATDLLSRCGALWNLYGPTETTIWSTMHRVESAEDAACIGRPIPGTEVYVLDEQSELAPVGVPGELYIGGAGLARGYRNRPELTEQRFVPHPFRQSARLYRTGDRVRWRADDTLEILGRLDHQVKLRGHRIELEEIASVLEQHSAVAQSVVLLREDRPGDPQLVAYYTAADSLVAAASAELSRHLRLRLPEYMVPAIYISLDRLPLTTSGKLDRRALPAPQGVSRTTTSYVAPRNAVEQTLADIWRQLLQVDRVGADDNFFQLGGHSLLGLRMFAQLQERLACQLPVAILFERPCLGELADAIASHSRPSSGLVLIAARPQGQQPPLFLLPSLAGEPLSWKSVLSHWPGNRPVYTIGLATSAVPWPADARLEEIARHYVDCLVETNPQTPVHLAGYSFGGQLAYETARQLQSRGLPVGTVAIIDTGVRRPSKLGLRELARMIGNVPCWLYDDVLCNTPRGWVSELRRKAWQWQSQVARWVGTASGLAELETAIDTTGVPPDVLSRMRTGYAALQRYQPGRFAGRVVVFRARTRPLFRVQPHDLGWSEVVQGTVEVIVLPGNHTSLLRPANGRLIADRLHAALCDQPADPVPLESAACRISVPADHLQHVGGVPVGSR